MHWLTFFFVCIFIVHISKRASLTGPDYSYGPGYIMASWLCLCVACSLWVRCLPLVLSTWTGGEELQCLTQAPLDLSLQQGGDWTSMVVDLRGHWCIPIPQLVRSLRATPRLLYQPTQLSDVCSASLKKSLICSGFPILTATSSGHTYPHLISPLTLC